MPKAKAKVETRGSEMSFSELQSQADDNDPTGVVRRFAEETITLASTRLFSCTRGRPADLSTEQFKMLIQDTGDVARRIYLALHFTDCLNARLRENLEKVASTLLEKKQRGEKAMREEKKKEEEAADELIMECTTRHAKRAMPSSARDEVTPLGKAASHEASSSKQLEKDASHGSIEVSDEERDEGSDSTTTSDEESEGEEWDEGSDPETIGDEEGEEEVGVGDDIKAQLSVQQADENGARGSQVVQRPAQGGVAEVSVQRPSTKRKAERDQASTQVRPKKRCVTVEVEDQEGVSDRGPSVDTRALNDRIPNTDTDPSLKSPRRDKLKRVLGGPSKKGKEN